MADTVLVTGISGFVGFYCAVEALRQGFHVRGAVRKEKPELRALLARELGEDPQARLDFVQGVDLLEDAGWDGAVAGCRYAMHVASPVPSGAIADPNALVPAARGGVLRLLGAAAKSEATERVVMTSSAAAIVHGNKQDADTVHDESSWSNPDVCSAYPRSKTLAERAAWDFVEGLPKGQLELVTLCPGMIFGPVPERSLYSTSGEPIRKLLSRELRAVPDFGWAPVDVRDVAWLHVRALTVPEAAGKRFCVGLEHMPMIEIGRILARHFGPKGRRVPTKRMPNFLVKIAALFDAQVRMVVADLGLYERLNITRAREILGWKPRAIEPAIIGMAESLIELGMV